MMFIHFSICVQKKAVFSIIFQLTFFVSLFFQTGFLCIALVVLELTLWATVGLKPKRSGVKGVDHHLPERMTFLTVNFV